MCKQTSIHTHTQKYIHVYTHTLVHTRLHAYTQFYAYTYTYTYTYTPHHEKTLFRDDDLQGRCLCERDFSVMKKTKYRGAMARKNVSSQHTGPPHGNTHKKHRESQDAGTQWEHLRRGQEKIVSLKQKKAAEGDENKLLEPDFSEEEGKLLLCPAYCRAIGAGVSCRLSKRRSCGVRSAAIPKRVHNNLLRDGSAKIPHTKRDKPSPSG